ncbi:MAG TPA: DsbA family oxidoreductase [Verrucomicrobiae bacterium]|nr:DsbA family oxidoreductase [Verrucomicrobiae bacterium]
MGNGIVNELKKEFDIRDEWVGFEIHPETPPAGMPLADLFPAEAVKGMHERLQEMGKQYGIEFDPQPNLSNSHLALEAGEYAKASGKFHEFHSAVFRAYFADGKNIGDLEELLNLAESAGMDREELSKALAEKRYAQNLRDTQKEARLYGITGAPTFIINNRYKIVGAQPIEAFRQALAKISQEADENTNRIGR